MRICATSAGPTGPVNTGHQRHFSLYKQMLIALAFSHVRLGRRFAQAGILGALLLLGCLRSPLLAAQTADGAGVGAKTSSNSKNWVTVRLFIDLECAFSRQAWPIWRDAVSRQSQTQLLVQHLPLSRHSHARHAALVALAARQQGKEFAFIDALLREPVPDRAAVARAVVAAGLDADAVARAVEGADARSWLDRELQSGLAFGISATPSALVNGRGIGGVPPEPAVARALQVAWQTAQRELSKQGGAEDLERQGILRNAPEFVDAFDALARGRALPLQPLPVRAPGELGPLYRVAIRPLDLQVGAPEAPVTVVLFLDPSQAWQMGQLRDFAMQTADPSVRLVIKPCPRFDQRGALDRQAQGHAVATLMLALTQASPQKAGQIVRDAARAQPLTLADLDAAIAAAGLDPQALHRAAEAPAMATALYQQAELMARTDSRSGAIFINGKVWLGRVTDPGWQVSLGAEALTAKRTPYAQLIAPGLYKSDAELDLQSPEDIHEIADLPLLGSLGPEVTLLLDFASPHSRAVWYMLRRSIDAPMAPIRLRLASLASMAEPCVSAAGAAFVAGAALGKGRAVADWLFEAKSPNDWTAIYAEVKRNKLQVPVFQKQVDAPATRAVSLAVCALRKRLQPGDEPVIFVGNRLYTGPLDEARIQQAVRFVDQLSAGAGGPAGQ